ncbi:MAG: hypothetical protein ACP6IP_08680, partial [Candidatus Njordarchaeia archaeon]
MHEIIREVLNVLSKPHSLLILEALHKLGTAKLSDILVELRSLSKYRSVRSTVEELVKAGLVKRDIVRKGAVRGWILSLTDEGRRLIEEIKKVISE